MIGGNIKLADGGRVTETTIGYHAGHAPHHQAGNENIAGRGCAWILATVHHQDMPYWAAFHCDALRVFGIAELTELIAVFARGDVAQCISRPNHGDTLGLDWVHALDDLVAKPRLKRAVASVATDTVLSFSRRASFIMDSLKVELADCQR